MARYVTRGKEAFKIIFFFLCDPCRERTVLTKTKSEGFEIGDAFVPALPPNNKFDDFLKSVWCADCKEQSKTILETLRTKHGIGKRLSITTASSLVEAELTRERIKAALSIATGIPRESVLKKMVYNFSHPESIGRRAEYERNEFSDSKTYLADRARERKAFRELCAEYSETLKNPFDTKTIDHLGRVSCVIDGVEPTDLEDGKRLLHFLRPFGYTISELLGGNFVRSK